MGDDVEELKSYRKKLAIKNKKLMIDFFSEEFKDLKSINLQIAITSKEIDVLNLKIELAALSK